MKTMIDTIRECSAHWRCTPHDVRKLLKYLASSDQLEWTDTVVTDDGATPQRRELGLYEMSHWSAREGWAQNRAGEYDELCEWSRQTGITDEVMRIAWIAMHKPWTLGWAGEREEWRVWSPERRALYAIWMERYEPVGGGRPALWRESA